MKFKRIIGVLVIAAASACAGTLVQAAPAATPAAVATTDTGTTTPAPGNPHWHHRHGGLLVGTTLRAVHQLDLSSEQQQQIKGLLVAAHSQRESQGTLDLATLGNPADPNYAAALANAKTLAAARLQRASELQAQIYNVLTPAQKAKLPQVLTDMKAKAQQRRAAWKAAAGNGAADENKGSDN